MRNFKPDKPCLKLWTCLRTESTRLLHAKRHFRIGRSERSSWDQCWIGREVDREYLAASCVDRSPQKSIRKRTSELGFPRTTLPDNMRKDLVGTASELSIFLCLTIVIIMTVSSFFGVTVTSRTPCARYSMTRFQPCGRCSYSNAIMSATRAVTEIE